MDDSTIYHELLKLNKGLGTVDGKLDIIVDEHRNHGKRIRKLEKTKNGSTKKTVALITAISTLIATITATIAVIFNRVG